MSEVSGQIVIKLCHMFGGDSNFLNWVRNFGGPSSQKFGGPKTSKFWQFQITSQFDREYLRPGTRYRRLENGVSIPIHAYQIWWTLVHKRRKIGLSFWPTQNQLFRTLIPRGLWADHHQTLPHVRWLLWFIKLSQKFGGVPPPKNLAAQKHQNFSDFGHLRDMIVNSSGLGQDIVDLKMMLQTAITPVYAYQIWWTLVHKRRKIGLSFRPTQNQVFRTLMSQGLRAEHVAP